MLLLKIPPETSDKLPHDIRDRYGRRLRRAALAQIEDQHQANKHNPNKPDLGFGTEGYFGPMGFGKTTTAMGRAIEAYALGYKLITINAGALIGYTPADPRDFYVLLASGIHDVVLLVDEVHTLMSAHAGATIRQREAIDSMAGGRKMMIPQLYISKNERATAGALKGEVNWAFYPQPVGWEKWRDKMGDNPAARGFTDDCYIEHHRIGPDPYEERQGTAAEAHGIKLKGDAVATSRHLWPPAIDSYMRTFWSFTPVTTGLSHDLKADAMRGRWDNRGEPVWSDELDQDEQDAIFHPKPAEEETEKQETPRQKAGRLLSDLIELLHRRELDPAQPRIPVNRMVADLRDWYEWDEKDARKIIGERLDPSGSPPAVQVVKIASYFAADLWEKYVIRREALGDGAE